MPTEDEVLLPSATPFKEYPLDDLVQELDRLVAELNNNVTSGNAEQLLGAYQLWSNDAAVALGHMFSPEDVERLILTRRHWLLMETVLRPNNDRTVHAALRAKRMDRDRALTSLRDQLRVSQQQARG